MADSLATHTTSYKSTDFGLVVLPLVLGLVAHQIFRRYETYSISVHLSLLITPPTLAALYHSSTIHLSCSFLDVLSISFIAYITTLVSSTVLYRLSPFHPLACYPGPLLCKLTDFWYASIASQGYQHWYVKSLHERYGDVVRTGPNDLFIRDPSLLASLLGPSGVPKGPHFIGKSTMKDISFMIAIQDKDHHAHRRRLWARGFTSVAVKEYEELVGSRARQLVDRMRVQDGRVLLGDWFGYFTLDLISDIALGGGSDLLMSEKKENLWSLLDKASSATTFCEHVPWFGVYIGHIPIFAAPVNAVISHCATLTMKRLQRGPVKRDLFYHLNGEDAPESARVSRPIQHLVDDGMLAIIAGSDTVASALTSLFACVLAHPEVYKKLQAEVDQFCPSPEDVFDIKQHAMMKYLNAVINETLRLYPPVPACTQRQVPHHGPGVTAGSMHIPPGTTFWVSAWAMHRDPRNFSPAPEGFWPERWLIASRDSSNSSPSSVVAQNSTHAYDRTEFVHNEDAFVPFSVGPMNCIGKNLALQELHMVVCAVVQRFDIQAPEGWQLSDYERHYRDYFVASRPKVPVVLEERKRKFE